MPVLLWILGRIVRFQARRASRSETLVGALERDREELAIAAVAQERARLARELHDVVTHTVSVVVVQAQGAQRALGDGYPDVSTALRDIENSGRAALADMRRLVGLLSEDAGRADHTPPGLTDLPELIERVRNAGLDVAFADDTDGSPVDPGVALSAYRIVQEALTNAFNYAPTAHVQVQIAGDGDAIDVTVTDDGPGQARSTGTGRGLLGMGERVAVYGGMLTAGPRQGGGFAVHARLPLQVTQA